GYDPIPASAEALVRAGGRHVDSMAKLCEQLPAPRVIWARLPSDAVDDLLATLLHLVEPGDVIVDASDSYYGDTQMRAEPIAENGVHLVDVGVSGGAWSRTEGYSLLVGGAREAVDILAPVLDSLSAEGGR